MYYDGGLDADIKKWGIKHESTNLGTCDDIENRLSIDLSRESRVGQTHGGQENEMRKYEPTNLSC